MTRFYKGLWLVFIAIFALSCSDDDESLPSPTAEFALDQAVVEVGVEVLFDNRSLNAARYEWDFGDGADPITDVSPRITFETPGTVTVTLTAFTQDEQSIEFSQDITVRQRALTALILNNFPQLNNGVGWDPDESGIDSLADIVIALRPVGSQDPQRLIVTQPVNNAQAPLIFTLTDPQSNSFILTNELWELSVEDFDGDDLETATGEDFQFIAGVTFNPVLAPTIKADDGMNGIISIVFSDETTQNQLLDIDFAFDLE